MDPFTQHRVNLPWLAVPLVKSAVIRKEDDEYVLYTRDGKQVLGRHKTRQEAIKQEYAIQKSQEKRATIDGNIPDMEPPVLKTPAPKPKTPAQPQQNWAFLAKGLASGETGGEKDPWVRTRVAPSGGSSAYGPLQLTYKTVKDYYTRQPEMFQDTGEFYNRFSDQAQKFLDYGNEPQRQGYHPRYDYGGAGDWGADPTFQKNYMTIAQRILADKAKTQNLTGIFDDGRLDQTEMGQLAGLWHGSPVNDQYVQRMMQAYGLNTQ
jgi:hypothetical protein